MKAYFVIKFLFNLVRTLIAYLVLSPLFLITLVILILINQDSTFFLEKKPKRPNELFNIIKFKTMRHLIPKEAGHNLISLTKLESLIRKFSLDAISAIFNVLKRYMWFLDTRPFLMTYFPIYNKAYHKHHHIKTCIIGWEGANVRNTMPSFKRFELNIWYVKHLNFSLDHKM